MIAKKSSWLLVELVTAVLFLYTGNIYALTVSLVLLLIPCCAFVANLYTRCKLKVSVESPGNLQKGDFGMVTVILENTSVFPLPCVSLQVIIQNKLNGGSQSHRIFTWVMPKKKQSVPLEICDDYCGQIHISVERPVLYDCFALIGIRCRCDTTGHVTVLPETFSTQIVLLPSSTPEDSNIYSQEKTGQDISETYQLREYIPGDDLRQIHWKLTGKFDRLIVRDPSLPIVHSILVFWERTGGTGSPECIDTQAEVVVSLCKCLLEQSLQFTVGWNNTEDDVCVLHEIHDLDELIAIIPKLLCAAGKETGRSGAELLVEASRYALCAHMIYITEEFQTSIHELSVFGNITILQYGNTPIREAIPFDSTHYKEQLLKIIV